MLLRSVTISGFKSVKSQSINLGRVNIMVGQNGAGKSNILEALAMLSSAISGGITYSALSHRGVRLSSPSVYRSALRRNHRPKYFDLAAEFDDLKYHCNIYTSNQQTNDESAWTFHSESLMNRSNSGRWKKIAGRSGKGVSIFESSLDKARVRPTQSIIPSINLFGDLKAEEASAIKALENFAIFSPFTNVLRGVASDDSVIQPLGLFGGGLAETFREVLRGNAREDVGRFFQLLPWFRRISVVKPEASLKARHVGMGDSVLAFSDRFMNSDFNKLYSADVSEGALYVAFILALMSHPSTPSIFALDNVDSTLNPGLVKNIVANICELAEKYDKQVVLTTHNPTALDGVDLFNPDHKIFVVDRDSETGETEVNSISPPADMTPERWEAEYGGARLSELWLDGFLGGMAAPENF